VASCDIAPDCSLSVSQAYQQAVFNSIKTSGGSLIALDMNLEKHNNTEIPSWATDWINPEGFMYIIHMQQVFKSHAAPDTAADLKLHRDSTLVLKESM
jgi:hypothetical protein